MQRRPPHTEFVTLSASLHAGQARKLLTLALGVWSWGIARPHLPDAGNRARFCRLDSQTDARSRGTDQFGNYGKITRQRQNADLRGVVLLLVGAVHRTGSGRDNCDKGPTQPVWLRPRNEECREPVGGDSCSRPRRPRSAYRDSLGQTGIGLDLPASGADDSLRHHTSLCRLRRCWSSRTRSS
jgi:hypothetical protein